MTLPAAFPAQFEGWPWSFPVSQSASLPTLTAPSAVTVTAQTSTSVSLSWTAGSGGSYYDIYRAVATRPGFFGPFVKINDSQVVGTTYVDNAANSTPDPATGNHYAYVVRMVDAASGFFAESNLVYATTYDNTDVVQAIVDAAKTRIEGVLGATWEEMDFSLDPKAASKRTKNNKYAFTPGEGVESPGQRMNAFTIRQTYTLTLMKKAVDRHSDAAAVQACIDVFQDLLEVLQDFQLTRLNIPNVVIKIDLPTFEEPAYDEGNTTVILTSRVAITYAILN